MYIISGSVSYESKRKEKLHVQVVFAVEPTAPEFLC